MSVNALYTLNFNPCSSRICGICHDGIRFLDTIFNHDEGGRLHPTHKNCIAEWLEFAPRLDQPDPKCPTCGKFVISPIKDLPNALLVNSAVAAALSTSIAWVPLASQISVFTPLFAFPQIFATVERIDSFTSRYLTVENLDMNSVGGGLLAGVATMAASGSIMTGMFIAGIVGGIGSVIRSYNKT